MTTVTYSHPRTFCEIICEAIAAKGWKIKKRQHSDDNMWGVTGWTLSLPDGTTKTERKLGDTLLALCTEFAKKFKIEYVCFDKTLDGLPNINQPKPISPVDFKTGGPIPNATTDSVEDGVFYYPHGPERNRGKSYAADKIREEYLREIAKTMGVPGFADIFGKAKDAEGKSAAMFGRNRKKY